MTKQSGEREGPVRFWPYALFGSFLLVVFVAAIVTPDYYNYKIRIAKIEAIGRLATNNVAQNNPTNATVVAPGLGNQKDNKSVIDENLTSKTVEEKSSDIFETYGKLLTMLLGFVSVLGVFFGYFARKSLREVEEDLRDHVKLSMDLWEREKTRLAGEVAEKLKEVAADQKKNETLTAEFEKTLERCKNALNALEAAAKAEEQKLSSGTARTATAAAAIDADDSIPKRPGE